MIRSIEDKINGTKLVIDEADKLHSEGQVHQIFVVTIDGADSFRVFYDGDWQQLAIAAAAFQREFSKH